jgi:glycine/D-amino acid oxidase-like deaminating enzyme
VNSPSSSLRVAVIGGGILGASSAVQLARLGARVTLVTEGGLSSEASGRSLAWLNSARFRSAEYHKLRMIGIDRYRTLAARYPAAPWLRFDGGLTWDADDSSNRIAEAFAHEQSIGYDAQLLAPEQVAAMTPGVDVRAITRQGAIFNPGEGWVDLPSLIRVLLDETPIALLVRSKPLKTGLRAVLNTPRVAVRPTPDGAIVFDSAWSEDEVVRHADGTYEVRELTVQKLAEEASAVLADNPRIDIDSYGVGPKPVPKDGEPVLGALNAVPGYYVAFTHSGATMGLITGELLAREIVTGEASPLLATFRPDRFA